MVNVPKLLLGLTPSTQDMMAMELQQVRKIVTRIDDNVAEQTEYSQRMFMKLQHLAQRQQEARCPSVFALVQTKGRVASTKFELRLYCEEPGAWHRLPAPHGVYPISQPREWLQRTAPYLQGLLKVLRHTAPLVKPVLGITVEKLDEQLKWDCDLMKELISQTPEELKSGDELGGLSKRAETEADFRQLEAMLTELDPDRTWGGLSRTTTPEGLTLYLCSDHVKAY
jgi:hypothetical protein